MFLSVYVGQICWTSSNIKSDQRFALMIISFPSKCDAECKLIRKSYFSNFCVFLYESKDKLRAGRFHSASEYLNIFWINNEQLVDVFLKARFTSWLRQGKGAGCLYVTIYDVTFTCFVWNFLETVFHLVPLLVAQTGRWGEGLTWPRCLRWPWLSPLQFTQHQVQWNALSVTPSMH